jgi:REP-associated tyrosine transposase
MPANRPLPATSRHPPPNGWKCHLVVECTRVTLSAGVQRLSGIHAERINARHERTGHLFGERFGARVIDTEERLANTVAYVLANPVRAGLCEKPEDWPLEREQGRR